MFDTHCHLNFKIFRKTLPDVVKKAKENGVTHIMIPGTDIETSKRAVEIADQFENIYAAVGVHPHHAYNQGFKNTEDPPSLKLRRTSGMQNIEELLKNEKVVAVGEVGMDKHTYEETKYQNYSIHEDFMKSQKELLIQQIRLAIKYNKSLILHNREATEEILSILNSVWSKHLEGRTVFHCCEPDARLLAFAKKHQIYIGVDGDITYSKEKQEFIKTVPLELLVLETDSPFLLPEPLRSQKKYPNEPANLTLISSYISRLINIEEKTIQKTTMQNAKYLFGLPV